MALRQVRTLGDPVLEKSCREVKEMTPRLRELVEDMLDTMYASEGVGLAAPQVGILRRIVVIDVGDAGAEEENAGSRGLPEDAKMSEKEGGNEAAAEDSGNNTDEEDISPGGPFVLINPVMMEQSGEQTGQEGCLSVPGKAGEVTRPDYVRVSALDMDMKPFELEGRGLLARAICHELDHLDGIMYVTKVNGELHSVEQEEE